MASREGRPNRSTFEIEGNSYDRPGSNGIKMFDPAHLNDILAGVTAFYFRPTVKSGVHCYLRAERKQRGGEYWVATRRSAGRLYKAYVGKVGAITFQQLADAAYRLDGKIKANKTAQLVTQQE